jgi:flagellar biosynthesis protein FlhF
MRVKTYYTSTVDAAIQRARRELGDNALLLNSKAAAQETRHLGAYEVTFGLAEDEPEAAPSATAASPGPAHESVGRDFACLHAEIERMKSAIARAGAFAISSQSLVREPELAGLYWTLVESDFLAEQAQELVTAALGQTARTAAGRLPVDRLQSALAAEIQKRIQVAPAAGRGGPTPGPRTVAVVGPAGAGKTTALVKLAVSAGLPTRKPMQFLAHDALRVGASEQLRTYALILGAGFQSCDSLVALEQSLAEHRHKDWIWLDTPGLSPRDPEAGRDLAALLAAHPEIDVHLVLSAAMRTADLLDAADRYAPFRPNKLLLTHLDETSSFGAMYTVSLYTRKPMSFLSAGQRIPEDLEPASVEGVMSRLMQRIWSQPPRPEWFGALQANFESAAAASGSNH